MTVESAVLFRPTGGSITLYLKDLLRGRLWMSPRMDGDL